MKFFVLDCRPATPHFPGIGRYVRNLAAGLPYHLKPEERLIFMIQKGESAAAGIPMAHPQVECVEVDSSPFSIGQQFEIPRLLARLKADIYHTPYYVYPYWGSRPTILTCYDFIPERYPETVSSTARRWFSMMHRLAWRRADHVIAISEATQRDAEDLYSDQKKTVTVIPLAPDPSFKPPTVEEKAAVRNELKLPDRYVLYLGINKPHKNLVRLVEAWEGVQGDAKLVIAGAWDERYPEAKDLVLATGQGERIIFLGRIAEKYLPALFGAADLFVFPSLYEGFGLPVIEAMASGVPVVCSYSSSLPEVGGMAVGYFNPLDPIDIARSIERVLNDPALQLTMRQKGLIQAQKFSWENVSKNTVKVYRHLVLND